MTLRDDLIEALQMNNDGDAIDLAAFVALGIPLQAEINFEEEEEAQDAGVEAIAIAKHKGEDWELIRDDGVWSIEGHGQAVGPWAE